MLQKKLPHADLHIFDNLVLTHGLLNNFVILFICQDDPDTLLKCLTIASEMLQGVATSGLNPTLTTLVQTLVILRLFHHDSQFNNVDSRLVGINKPITVFTRCVFLFEL